MSCRIEPKDKKQKSEVSKICFDCWSNIFHYLTSTDDFLSICLSVKNLFQAIKDTHPFICLNISFVLHQFPKEKVKYVFNLSLNDKWIDLNEVGRKFPNLRELWYPVWWLPEEKNNLMVDNQVGIKLRKLEIICDSNTIIKDLINLNELMVSNCEIKELMENYLRNNGGGELWDVNNCNLILENLPKLKVLTLFGWIVKGFNELINLEDAFLYLIKLNDEKRWNNEIKGLKNLKILQLIGKNNIRGISDLSSLECITLKDCEHYIDEEIGHINMKCNVDFEEFSHFPYLKKLKFLFEGCYQDNITRRFDLKRVSYLPLIEEICLKSLNGNNHLIFENLGNYKLLDVMSCFQKISILSSNICLKHFTICNSPNFIIPKLTNVNNYTRLERLSFVFQEAHLILEDVNSFSLVNLKELRIYEEWGRNVNDRNSPITFTAFNNIENLVVNTQSTFSLEIEQKGDFNVNKIRMGRVSEKIFRLFILKLSVLFVRSMNLNLSSDCANIEEMDFSIFKNLIKLKVCSWDSWSDIGLNFKNKIIVKNMLKLQELSIGFRFSKTMINNLPCLKKLDYSMDKIVNSTLELDNTQPINIFFRNLEIKKGRKFEQLKKICINQCIIRFLPVMRQLEDLKLTRNKIHCDIDVKNEFPNLVVFNYFNNSNYRSFCKLTGLSKLSRLENLKIQRLQVKLYDLKELPKLQKLQMNFSFREFEHEEDGSCIIEFNNFPELEKIGFLPIHKGEIFSGNVILRLNNCPKLKSIDFTKILEVYNQCFSKEKDSLFKKIFINETLISKDVPYDKVLKIRNGKIEEVQNKEESIIYAEIDRMLN